MLDNDGCKVLISIIIYFHIVLFWCFYNPCNFKNLEYNGHNTIFNCIVIILCCNIWLVEWFVAFPVAALQRVG